MQSGQHCSILYLAYCLVSILPYRELGLVLTTKRRLDGMSCSSIISAHVSILPGESGHTVVHCSLQAQPETISQPDIRPYSAPWHIGVVRVDDNVHVGAHLELVNDGTSPL